MSTKLLFFGIVYFGSMATVFGQFEEFMEGTVVTHEKDTLTGSFKNGKMRFKILVDGETKLRKFYLEDVDAYTHNSDGAWYFRFSNEFHRLMIDGEVQLYKRVQITSSYNGGYGMNSYGTPNYGTLNQHRTTIYSVKRKHQDSLTTLRVFGDIGYGKSYFIDTAADFFSDNQTMTQVINGGGYNNESDIKLMVAAYNQWYIRELALKNNDVND